MAAKHGFTITILEELEIKEILTKLTQDFMLRRGGRKRMNIKNDILYSYIMGNKLMDISDNYKRTLAAIEERYIAFKRQNNLYDFTDYPLYLYTILETYNEYITNIDALFVDEFQDVDDIQIKIFDRVTATHKKCFVGDRWQSIFVFRGADGESFEKIPDFSKYKLKYNYRSYQSIIDYAVTVYEVLRPQLN